MCGRARSASVALVESAIHSGLEISASGELWNDGSSDLKRGTGLRVAANTRFACGRFERAEANQANVIAGSQCALHLVQDGIKNIPCDAFGNVGPVCNCINQFLLVHRVLIRAFGLKVLQKALLVTCRPLARFDPKGTEPKPTVRSGGDLMFQLSRAFCIGQVSSRPGPAYCAI